MKIEDLLNFDPNNDPLAPILDGLSYLALTGGKMTAQALAEVVPGFPSLVYESAIRNTPKGILQLNAEVRRMPPEQRGRVYDAYCAILSEEGMPATPEALLEKFRKRGVFKKGGNGGGQQQPRGPARARRNSMADERKQELRRNIADAEGRLASMVQSVMQEGTKAAVLDFRIRDKALPGSARMRLETVKSYAVSDHSYHSEELRKLRDYIGKLKRDLNS